MKKTLALLIALLLCMPLTAFAEVSVQQDYFRYTHTMYRTYEDGDELLLIADGTGGLTQDQYHQQLLDAVTPNKTERIKTIDPTGVEQLVLRAERCGIVVEPTKGTRITVDYIGATDKTALPVTTSIEAGILTVSVTGTYGKDRLVRTIPGSYANVVRISLPADLIKEIELDNGRHGLVAIRDLNTPVSGELGNGCIRIEDGIREAATKLKGTSGDIVVKGGILRGDITASLTSGDISIDGGIVDGVLDLSATSGDLKLNAGILGNATLSVKSGDIKATAGVVKQGSFSATSGDVVLEIGDIGNRVDASVTSGDLRIKLLSNPTDLRYSQKVTSKFTEVSAPAGWKDGYKVGAGNASLNVSVGSGDYTLTVKK